MKYSIQGRILMNKIIIILLIFSFIGCTQYESFYVPIINHTDYKFNLTIIHKENSIIKNYNIKENAVTIINNKIKLENNNYIPFVFKIDEKMSSFPISENKLYFPGGGLVANSAKGGLFVAIDIFYENDKINVLYSHNVFSYGFPKYSLEGDGF